VSEDQVKYIIPDQDCFSCYWGDEPGLVANSGWCHAWVTHRDQAGDCERFMKRGARFDPMTGEIK
jgi:hypothetical protein